MTAEVEMFFRQLEKYNNLHYAAYYPAPVSAPLARQEATEHSTGDLLCFFDNHCLVEPNYFKRILLDFDKYPEMDMLHSVTRFHAGDPFTQFHYNLQLEKNFWAHAAGIPVDEYKPYRIAAGGHGSFIVRRDAWEAVAGYRNVPFVGYGGEEIYFDFKMAMLDKTNWLDPKLIHWHFPGGKGYPRHGSDDYHRNMLMCANIIGGTKWVNKVYNFFAGKWPETKEDPFLDKYPKMQRKTRLIDIYDDALLRSKDHAEWFASVRHRTLEEQLQYFSDNNIATS